MALPVGSIFDVGNAVFFYWRQPGTRHERRQKCRDDDRLSKKKDAEENIDESLCDLVVNDLMELSDMIAGLEA